MKNDSLTLGHHVAFANGVLGVGSDLIAAGLTLARSLILASASTLDRVEINLGVVKLHPTGTPSTPPPADPVQNSVESTDIAAALVSPGTDNKFERLCDKLSVTEEQGDEAHVAELVNRIVDELSSHLERSEQPSSPDGLLAKIRATLTEALEVSRVPSL
jgi:hypothetical protein